MNSWDQQNGESSQAYEAAAAYFAMGADRSCAAVAQKLSKSIALAMRWSARWSWVDRAEAYDRHLSGIEQERREQAVAAEADRWAQRRAEQRENDWAMAQGLAIQAAQLLQRIGPERMAAIDPDKLTAGEWAALANAAVKIIEAQAKLARLTSNLPTDHQQLDIGPIDWDAVPEEIENAFADGRIGLRDVIRHLQR
jgi:hypothetical protein